MTPDTDWNCRLLPGFSDHVGNARNAASALTLLHEHSGISHFSFFPEFDPLCESVSAFKIRIDLALKALQSLLTFPAVLFASASARICPNLAEYRDLRRFCLPKTDFLPISLPIVPENQVENEVARIARYAPFRPLLMNAHLLPIFYPSDVLKRLFRLPGIAVQFSFSSLETDKNDRILHELLARKVPVLLGSGVNSREKAALLDFPYLRSQIEARFSPSEADALFHAGNLCGKRLVSSR